MRCRWLLPLLFSLLAAVCLCSCSPKTVALGGSSYVLGFGCAEIEVPEGDGVYIAGYHQGWEPDGVNDLQQARAVWLGTGDDGILVISVDCIGLASDTIERIRRRIDVPAKSVIVCSTHDHAGVDTLGLWGPVAQEGKNSAFMENLYEACAAAAGSAYSSRKEGTLWYGEVQTEDMLRDSRDPQVYDATMRQLRFVPSDGGDAVRIVFYGAHAESLRGGNRTVSRDWPGVMEDVIKERTGEDSLFLNGAIGGLIMTSVQTQGDFDAFANMTATGTRLADYALSCTQWRRLDPSIVFRTAEVEIPLDNTLYMYYRFLGILGNPMRRGDSLTGYVVESSVSTLKLGDLGIAFIPGELFPELLDDLLPSDDWLVVGLANDEIGYIVDPSDFVLDGNLPFIEHASGHYEETNSCGEGTFEALKFAFSDLF